MDIIRHNMPIEASQIVRSKRKTIALIVKPDGSLIVRAPLRTPDGIIQEFIQRNTGWVTRKQAEALAALSPAPRQYVAGELFLYLGNPYPLFIAQGQQSPLLFDESFKLADAAQSKASLMFERWYRTQAKMIINERVDVYARQYNFQYKRIGITSARTRWGSCSANGSLNFSWRLMMAPIEAIDYVIIHELVHTVVHNHSRQFWDKVARIMPDYQERRKWLRTHAQELMW
jgi:predicted metal-dependent hydrolase